MKSWCLIFGLFLSYSASAQVLYPSPYSEKEFAAMRAKAIDTSFYIRKCYVQIKNQYPFLSYEEGRSVKQTLLCQTLHGRRQDRQAVCDRLIQNPYVHPPCADYSL